MQTIFSSRRGSVFAKSISLLLVVAIALTPLSPAYAAFGDGTPTIPNSDAFGGDATPRVDGSSGAFTQRIPLEIPPGRNGLQPDLALQYNSQNTADGIVGYGWSLSIPYIQRLNKTGSHDLYNGATPYFTSSLDGELAIASTTSSTIAATGTPSILDTLPVTYQTANPVSGISFSYTVPSGGSNKLLVTQFCMGGARTPTATQNGVSISLTEISGSLDRCHHWYGTLANPSSGTFSLSWTGPGGDGGVQVSVMTLQNAAQSNPIDVSGQTSNTGSFSSLSKSLTTTLDYDLLLDESTTEPDGTDTYGSGQTQTHPKGASDPAGHQTGSYKVATTSGSHTMTRNYSPNAGSSDLAVIAVKAATTTVTSIGSTPTVFRGRVDETGNSYSFSGNSWTVYDKKGTRYLFGSDDSGRQYDTGTGTSTKTYKWMLQEIRDTNDNYVKFTYARDGNEIYPSQILYTGSGSTDGPFKVLFATSTRPDDRQSYAPGFSVTTNYRISEIDALINDTTVRKYLLGYGAGINGKRSLLTSFQQQGYDENNTLTSLPAMTFTYASSTSQFYAPSASGHQVNGQNWIVADTNGNGINDLNDFYRVDSSSPIKEYMYLDQSTEANDVVNPPEYWVGGSSNPLPALERGTRYLDINADGRADVVRGWQNIISGQEETVGQIYLNTYATSTSYGWSGTTTTGIVPVFAQKNNSYTLTGGVFGDVNGDGLPDYSTYLPSYISAQTYLANGNGWNATTTIFAPLQSFPTTAPTQTASQLVDINGDGLDDWVYSGSSQMFVHLNTGATWDSTDSATWRIATSTLYSGGGGNYLERGIRFFDINGDGLVDLVRAYKVATYTACEGVPSYEKADVKFVLLNTGDGWATSTAYTLPAYIKEGNVPGSGCWDGSFTTNEYGNWNGNGQQKQDVLATLANARGGSTSLTYDLTPQLGGNAELPYSLLVVTAMGIYDGRGNAATTTYSYSGGKQYTSLGVRERKFAGFALSTTTAPDGVTGTYFSQGMSTSTHLGEQAGGYGQINHPFREDIFDLSGNLIRKTFYRWDASHVGSSTLLNLGRQVMQDYALDGTHRDSATDYLYASSTNNLIKITQFGEVTGNSDGTFTDTGTDKRTTNITYAASSSVNLSVPIQKTILDNSSATTSEEKIYYDALSFGSVSKGNATRNEDWISSSTYASSTKTYNSYGLVLSATDARGNLTSNVFDAFNLYVASSTNPLSQQTQFTYDYSVGKVKQTIDPNGRRMQTLYDGVGRVRMTGQSDLTTPMTIATTTTFTYTDSSSPPSSVLRSNYLTSTTTVDAYSYLDGLGRLIQERKSSQYANVFSTSDRTYNAVGKLASQSFPYFSSRSANSAATGVSSLYTTFTYDALQRPLTSVNAVGTTANSYSKWTTTVTDPNGNIKDYVRDAFGNLASVVEHATTNQTTTYAYDTLNNLTSITDALSNVRNFTYDGLSRRLTAQDLHGSGDGTFGSWTYTYDDAGNLTSQTDPKSQVVNRTHDGLNRLLTEDYTGQSGIEVTNIYDTCTKGIGYLCTASSTAASSTTIYDALGRAATTTITIFGIPYATGYEYDLQGNITTLTYPNDSQVRYWYNLAGMQSRVTRKAPGTSTFSDIVTNLDYAPHGQAVNTSFGNGASTTRTFGATALYRLTALQTAGAGTTYQNFAYTYDAIGNLRRIANTASTTAAATVNYAYDALNRLAFASTTAATSSPYIQSFTYDALGNILTFVNGATTTIASGTTTAPSILDSLPVTYQTANPVSGISFSYTVPSGGSNKLLVTQFCMGGARTPTATQNGVSIALTQISGSIDRCYHWYGTLANPTSGTFSLSWTGPGGDGGIQISVMTLKDAAQSNPVDVSNVTSNFGSYFSSLSTNATTTLDNDLLLDESTTEPDGTDTYGSGQTQTHPKGASDPAGHQTGSYKVATKSGSHTMTRNYSPDAGSSDLAMIAIKAATTSPAIYLATTSSYAYAGTDYANPHAVTSIGNGLSTTTYTYDNNGNLTQVGNTTHIYDYLNRITSTGFANSTSTFGYDAFGARVFQAGTTSTTTYASKYFSISSTTIAGANWATTTSYLWLGDTLLGTVEQQFSSGAATGTAQTRYVHPDHLGSTNVVTDEGGNLVQTVDYYPFGATRVSDATSTNEKRKYIGQFADDQTGLDYLNARYYDPSRGQFVSQDPTHQLIGDAKGLAQATGQDLRTILEDPQQFNSYSYGRNNPLIYSDRKGTCVEPFSAAFCTTVAYSVLAYNAAQTTLNVYDVYLTNYSPYSDYFTSDDKRESWFTAGYNAALNAAGFGSAFVGLAHLGSTLETLSISLDALEARWGESAYGRLIQSSDKDSTENRPPSQSAASNSSSAPRTPYATPLNQQHSAPPPYSQGGTQAQSSSYASLFSGLQNLVVSLTAYLSNLSTRETQ